MKRISSLVITLAMLAAMCVFGSTPVSAASEQWNGIAATEFSGGGDGSAATPYKIATAGELKLFANIVNDNEELPAGFTQKDAACGILTADIVLNTGKFTIDGEGNPLYNGSDATSATINAWFPIGYFYDTDGDSTEEKVYYAGTFNGNGHTVSGLYFNNSNQECVGLFGQIHPGVKISDLGIVNSYLKGKDYVGGVCGINASGTITNCYNVGSLSGSSYIGGVCGKNFVGTITNCYNVGSVSGTSDVGGVCGNNSVGTVTNCYNVGSVSGTYSNIGGVIGSNFESTVTNCYYLDTCGARGEGTPKTEDEMKTQDFVNLLNSNGGNFTFYIGKLPLQSWQPDPNIYNIDITYTVIPVYTVTIPAEVTLGGTATVEAENVILDEGKQLEVALTATSGDGNAFTVSNGKTATLTYEITDSTSNIIAVGGTVLTVNPADGARGSTTLNFSRPEDSAIIYSGDYTGTVIFTVSVAG